MLDDRKLTIREPAGQQHAVWESIDRILASAPEGANLNVHGLGPLAAWRRQVRREPISAAEADVARRSAYGTVTVAPLLERVRNSIDGQIVLLKGPEVASLYPRNYLRPYGDLDLLVENVDRAESQLVAAGFRLIGPPDRIVPGHHHDRPMRLDGMALSIELHRNPGWLNWQKAPSNKEVFARSVPSVTGAAGVNALPAEDRALQLAAHSWRHGPYHSYLHLIDIALAREVVDRSEVVQLARRWDLQHVWDSTNHLIDAVLYGSGSPSRPMDTIWARHLVEMRERTLLEHYAAVWLAGLAAPTPRKKAEAIADQVVFSLSTHPWQSPSDKIRRIGRAILRARQPLSRHRFH